MACKSSREILTRIGVIEVETVLFIWLGLFACGNVAKIAF